MEPSLTGASDRQKFINPKNTFTLMAILNGMMKKLNGSAGSLTFKTIGGRTSDTAPINYFQGKTKQATPEACRRLPGFVYRAAD